MWPIRKLFSILRNLTVIASINIYILKFIGLYIRSTANAFFIKVYIMSKNKLQHYTLKFNISCFDIYQFLFSFFSFIYLIFIIFILV